MSMSYIREYYKVPAKRGARIMFTHWGKSGVIVASHNSYLKVRFDGEKITRILHPTWCVKYIGD